MPKALVVDDSLMMREVFTSYLKSAGFYVEKARNAEQAQQTLAHYRPDLIVLDVVMDGKSGFEYCLQLKRNRATCSIAVIICSTKTTQADFFLGEAIGADAYLAKTVEREEFVSKAKQLTRQPILCKLI